jgi:antitoxin component YwqK of YwqJK toxin-antitoxin module
MAYQKITISFFILFYLSFVGKSQTFEIYKSDTINRTSSDGKKYGKWISFFDTNKLKIESDGVYENNHKTGIWKTYYANGFLKTEVTYVNNSPNGYAKIYYENGKICEEGFWKGTKWTGKYLYYHENGNKAYDWNFNDEGKRTGEQKYYHENGKLMIKGEWIDGKENGTITEYDAGGNIRSEKVFAGGKIDEKTSKFYATKKVSVDEMPDDTNATSSKGTMDTNKTQETYGTFNGNGNYRLFNSFKKVDREGDFRNGKLMNGKKYYYNTEGKLLKTEVYTNGKVTEIIK